MKEILFHVCCGPCGTASLKKLSEEGYVVTGYYYNPNIQPNYEYKKRLKEARGLFKKMALPLVIERYQPAEYFKAVKGSENNKEERCINCWRLRLEKTAQKANDLGIKNFGTTLRISPYQNQKELKKIALEVAAKYNLKFYLPELVDCFQESIELSKEANMYRQKYCGCIFSKSYN